MRCVSEQICEELEDCNGTCEEQNNCVVNIGYENALIKML